MKKYPKIRLPITFAASCGLIVGMLFGAIRAQADAWDKKTILTVDQPIQVQETYLQPGTYVFKLMNSSSDRHIVQIYNQNENRIINTVLAMPNYRLQPADNSRFSFYETPQGSARALHAWFYPGDNFGQEFKYPKHLTQLAMASTSSRLPSLQPAPPPVANPATAPEPEPEPIAKSSPAPEPEATPEPAVQEETTPSRKEEPMELAQNTPPPAPQGDSRNDESKELPKTATPFPLIGLGGLLSLVGYGVVRMRNVS